MNCLTKNLVIPVVLLCLVFVTGCGGWHKAGDGSALLSAKLELFKSGNGGTETFVGDRESLKAREASQKPSHEEKAIALERGRNETELKGQMISAGLGKRVADAMHR